MEKSIKHLDFFINQIKKTSTNFHDQDLNDIQYFSIGLLERLEYSSYNIKLILENISIIPELDFSAGLSLRAILLDSLITLNLVKLWNENTNICTDLELEAIISGFCKTVLADGLGNTLNFFEQSKKLNFIGEEKLKNYYNNIVNKYPNYFLEYKFDGTKPKVSVDRLIKTPELFGLLAQNKETRTLSKIYDAYSYYSKYDHFGIQYFKVINSPIEESISRIKTCIEIFVEHQYHLYFFLNQFSNFNHFIKEQFEESIRYRDVNSN